MKFRLNKTKYSTRQIIRWIWSHHHGCRTQAFVNVVVGLVLVVSGLLSVEVVRRLTDVAVGAREGNLWLLAGILAGLFIFDLLLHITQTWVGAVLGVRSQNKLQQYFFSRLLRGKWSGVERFHSGDVLNRLFGDVGDIVSLLTEVLPFIVVIIFQFILSFIYLFSMDQSLALILVIVCPVFLILGRIYFYKMRRYVRKVKDSNSAIQAIIQESIQHKMVIKVLEQGEKMVNRLEHRQSLLRHQIKSRARFSILAKTIVSFGFSGSYIVALTWGVFQLQDGVITVGVLIAFTQLIGRIQRPLLDMARLLPSLVNSMTSSERLMELEELPLEEPVKDGTPLTCVSVYPCLGLRAPAQSSSLGLRFADVDFCYSTEGMKPRTVLSAFSYNFEPGSFTAILGPTGAGKTTLLRLMLALIEPDKGSVELYGKDGAVATSPSLRHCFSYVPQGNTLFSGTIRDNLLFGNPNATTEQMHEALSLACADFVFDLPEGLFTRCGEEGGGLSEGQAQRIAIARAILRPCHILLLDEATSALDVNTETKVLTQIKEHYADTTIIFVTHRLSAVSFATKELSLVAYFDSSTDKTCSSSK
ncbi:MAG: ABC transporter ATP-binding protein/permease [Bacteroidaceae bacterium]|nr:ABC transporter ATP-binding protein/permease [Bacteroidaceae bacterium]